MPIERRLDPAKIGREEAQKKGGITPPQASGVGSNLGALRQIVPAFRRVWSWLGYIRGKPGTKSNYTDVDHVSCCQDRVSARTSEFFHTIGVRNLFTIQNLGGLNPRFCSVRAFRNYCAACLELLDCCVAGARGRTTRKWFEIRE